MARRIDARWGLAWALPMLRSSPTPRTICERLGSTSATSSHNARAEAPSEKLGSSQIIATTSIASMPRAQPAHAIEAKPQLCLRHRRDRQRRKSEEQRATCEGAACRSSLDSACVNVACL